MAHNNNNIYLTFPEANKYHRVMMIESGVCSAIPDAQTKRRNGDTVRILWVHFQFLDSSAPGSVLHSGFTFSNSTNSEYGKLLAASGIDWMHPSDLTDNILKGRTLLVRLTYKKHSMLGVAAKIVEMQPDITEPGEEDRTTPINSTSPQRSEINQNEYENKVK